jgi:hypothetical protein
MWQAGVLVNDSGEQRYCLTSPSLEPNQMVTPFNARSFFPAGRTPGMWTWSYPYLIPRFGALAQGECYI